MKEPDVGQLELQALEEREQIHASVEQLRSEVTQVRRNLDPKRLVRTRFVSASIIGSSAAFILGYSVAGLFAE